MFQKEPAVILGALSEVIKAVIPMLIIFGFINWTGEQVAQVMLVVGVAVGFFNVLLTRSQSYSPDSAQTLLNMPPKVTMEMADRALAAGVKVSPGDTASEVKAAVAAKEQVQ